MIRLIALLLVWGTLGVAGAWLAESGMVDIQWGDYDVRIHGGLLVAALVTVVIAAVVVYELWHWLVGIPGRRRERTRHRREVMGYQALAHGMVAAASGDAVAAAERSRQSIRLLEDEPAALLLQAQTAQLEGKDDVAQLKFKTMLDASPTEFLGLRGLLADAVKRGAYDEALELARRAHRLRPTTPWVLTTLFRPP